MIQFFNLGVSIVVLLLCSFAGRAAERLNDGVDVLELLKERGNETDASLNQLRNMRMLQRQKARNSRSANLSLLDTPFQVVSHLNGRPPEFEDTIIVDGSDIESLKPVLFDYLGRLDRERLRYSHSEYRMKWEVYTLHQYIDDIPTENIIEILVDRETRKVFLVQGGINNDFGLPKTTPISKEQAIALALQYAPASKIFRDGSHAASFTYMRHGDPLVIKLFWEVRLELRNPITLEDPEKTVMTHEYFFVSPEGDVLDTHSGDAAAETFESPV